MMEVACATDDRYAPHCGTMLHSLFTHNRPDQIRVHLLHDETLSRENRDRLAFVAAKFGAQLNCVPVEHSLVRDFPDKQFHVSCWYRIVLPALLPDISRILYLDADMLILDNLQPLWETSLQGCTFAAVSNPLYPFMPDRPRVQLGLAQRSDYLNSGVLLLDLDRMRAEAVTQKVLAYARARPDNPWPEQDALSVVCNGRWLRLHPRWNAQTTFFDLKDSQLLYPAEESRAAKERPAIVHFIGPMKPWHYLCRHPLREVYAKHRQLTPWPDFDLDGRTLENWLLRPLSLGTQIRVRRIIRKIFLMGKRDR